MMALAEGFTIVKQPIAFHSPMARQIPNYFLNEVASQASASRLRSRKERK